MQIKNPSVLCLVALTLTGCLHQNVDAGILLYSNGTLNGHTNAWTISGGYGVSDSFTLSAPANLTVAQLGLWSQGVPTSVEWQLGSAPFAANFQGTAGLSDSFQFNNGMYNVFESTFAFSGLPTLAAGTYFLTLSNANPALVYWDQSWGGSSIAIENQINSIPSESFQIFGNPVTSTTVVPAPSAITTWFVLLAMSWWRWTHRCLRRGRVPS